MKFGRNIVNCLQNETKIIIVNSLKTEMVSYFPATVHINYNVKSVY